MANDILVKVGADISNFSRNMSKVSNDLRSIGSNMSNMGQKLSNVGSQLTNKITKPAMVAAAAVGGITIAKGFQRLIGIDTARAKLSALGHDAKDVDIIMTNALDSVRGTSYGMDEAATAAASAVAAGIQPGKELTQYLNTMGDAAAIAGADFNEMAHIFNNVQTAQRAYTGDLNMLANRGIPIYQWLAEEAGVSAEAVRDMASRGEVSAEMFRTAIEKNIGGAAKEIGEKSFAAALKNIGADIGRIGANFLDAGGEGEGFFSTVKPLLTEFRGYLQSLEPAAAELGKKFGESFNNFIDTLRNLKARWDELSPTMQSFIKRVAAIGSIFLVAIGPVMKFAGIIMKAVGWVTRFAGSIKAAGAFVGALSGPVGWIIAAIVALGVALVTAYKKSETFREGVHNAFERVSEIISTVVSHISEFVMEIWGGLVEWWNENNELITRVVQDGWERLQAIIEAVMEFIVPFIQDAWDSIVMYIEIAWEVIKTVVRIATEIIKGVITAWLQILDGDWSSAWDTIKQTFQNVWNIMKSFVSNVATIILNAIKDRFEQVKQNITNKITEAKNNLVSRFTEMVSNVVSKAQEIVSTARQKFEEVKQAIRDKLAEAVRIVGEKIGEMPGKVIEFVGDMVLAGGDLIQGLIDGITNMGKKAIEAITGVVNGVVEKAKSLLEVKSPSRVFMEIGRFTGEGLADGITDSIRMVERASERMTNAIIPDEQNIDLSYATPSGIRSSLSSAVSGTVDVNARDDRLIGALASIERRLGDLEVVMDGEQVGRIVRPHVNAGNALDANVRRYF